jgi:hypothetical protein
VIESGVFAQMLRRSMQLSGRATLERCKDGMIRLRIGMPSPLAPLAFGMLS